MRAARNLLTAAGAITSAALLLGLAVSAAGFGLTMSGSSSTSGVSTASTTTTPSALSSEALDAALFALPAGGKTVGGPGTFLAGPDQEARIYEVVTGAVNNACVTLRNLSQGQIRVSVNNGTSIDVNALETRTSCYGMVAMVDLRCRQGTVCQAVWRVDRQ